MSAGERLMAEMRAWTDAGGDPSPNKSDAKSSGYRLGRQLGRARSGEIVLTEAQWTELEALGTRREVNEFSAGERLMAEMRAWT